MNVTTTSAGYSKSYWELPFTYCEYCSSKIPNERTTCAQCGAPVTRKAGMVLQYKEG